MPVTYYPDQGPHNWRDERKWSHLIKLPGVKAGMKIPVSCRLMTCRQQLVTPRRVRVTAEIDLTSQEVRVAQSAGPQIRWRSNPEHIPAASATVTVDHLINIPKDHPAALRILTFEPVARVEQITTLRDRLVVKGCLFLQLGYAVRV